MHGEMPKCARQGRAPGGKGSSSIIRSLLAAAPAAAATPAARLGAAAAPTATPASPTAALPGAGLGGAAVLQGQHHALVLHALELQGGSGRAERFWAHYNRRGRHSAATACGRALQAGKDRRAVSVLCSAAFLQASQSKTRSKRKGRPAPVFPRCLPNERRWCERSTERLACSLPASRGLAPRLPPSFP